MDIDFTSVWSTIGWDEFLPVKELACCGFSQHGFWGDISGQMVHGKFAPRCNDIQNPTLRLMHKWLAITLFPREDSLTMPLVPQEEARRSSVFGSRMTWSMSRSAAMQQLPPPQRNHSHNLLCFQLRRMGHS
uniref:Uncharacterized protein n=1 Tax=Setaria italica TaxID=4555 RepID=K4A0Z3_SETIT